MIELNNFKLIALSFGLFVCSLLTSCSIPQVPITAPYMVKEKVSLGEHKVIVYSSADTLRSFVKQRYVPVYRFEVYDEKGSVVKQYAGAMQEFLSRVAGVMRPEQKVLLQGSIKKTSERDSTTQSVVWNYPNYEGEVSDISENSTIIKTRYWSVDSTSEKTVAELFTTSVVSTPFFEKRLPAMRSHASALEILREGDDRAYFELKNFVLSQLRK